MDSIALEQGEILSKLPSLSKDLTSQIPIALSGANHAPPVLKQTNTYINTRLNYLEKQISSYPMEEREKLCTEVSVTIANNKCGFTYLFARPSFNPLLHTYYVVPCGRPSVRYSCRI